MASLGGATPKMKYEWHMTVSYYHKDHHSSFSQKTKCTEAEFKGDEFDEAETADICRLMDIAVVEMKKSLASAISDHVTTYSPGQLRFALTSNRPFTDDEVRIIEHIVGSNLGMNVYHLNRSLRRLKVDIFPEWDDAVMSWGA